MGAAIVLSLFFGGWVATVVLMIKLRRAKAMLKQVKPVADAEVEIARIKAKAELELAKAREAFNREVTLRRTAAEHGLAQVAAEELGLKQAIAALKVEASRLSHEVAQLDGQVELQDVALYAPRYNLARSEDYKRRLEQIYEQQKALVKAKRAAVCLTAWTVNNSKVEGRKVTDKIVRLMLRAFNGESDALIGRVRYDNVSIYEARIRKAFDDINKLGAGFSCKISDEYLRLKLDELALTHELQEKVQAEREEQRELKEAMREEQRALQELERAQREAEKEATRYANALDRARVEAEATVGARHDQLMTQIAELEVRLKVAEEQQRSISMAQQTRRGHVYILSNIGSFGEDVYKIGMTRRLNPQDRVDELGDASVPFCFDVHAMISTEDAPKLERVLHELFSERRINKINLRKEFFRVTLDELEAVVRQHHGEFQITRYAEAVHYRQSLVAHLHADGSTQEAPWLRSSSPTSKLPVGPDAKCLTEALCRGAG